MSEGTNNEVEQPQLTLHSSSAQVSEDWMSPIPTLSDEEIAQSNSEFIDILQQMQTQPLPIEPPELPPVPHQPPPPPPSLLGSVRKRSDSDDSGPSLKRARIACLPCRKAKQRCDNGRPCGRCVTKHKEEQCEDGDHHQEDHHTLDDNAMSSPQIRTFKAMRPKISPGAEIGECIRRTVAQTITVQEIHEMIVNKPLKW